MDRKRTFDPGDMVVSITGDVGMVVSRKDFGAIKGQYKEAGRPGHYFAPGCCHNPDYITQIPVLFDDETFDVMRAMNIKKKTDLPDEKRVKILKMMNREK
ncbi:hypothetical protein ACFL9T_07190 [Thermodesulfobacteriota bacterium]